MIDRRDLLMGIGGLTAIAGAELLRPRRRLDLVGRETLASILPTRFDGWADDLTMAVLQPPTEGSLAARLYSEILSRGYLYHGEEMVPPVMMLATHGAQQSDALSLHRPETCYPAVGFAVGERRFFDLPVAPGVSVPAVELTAQLGERVEDILYWTRIGEDFPQTNGEQRRDRLTAALHGTIGDGVLLRFSSIRQSEDNAFASLERFCAAMIRATPADKRDAIIGTARARAMASI